MNFDPSQFVTNFPYLVRGWLGTFFSLGVIAFATIILNKVNEKRNSK